MKLLTKHFLLLVLFWFYMFFICRIAFYFGNTALLSDVPLKLIFQSFYKSFRLDLSMISYFLILPVIVIFVYSFIKKKILLKTIDVLNYTFIVLFTLTSVGEMCLYREWKSKLSVQAMQHFLHPSEVFRTTSLGLTVLFFALSTVLIVVFIHTYRKRISMTKNVVQLSEVNSGKYYWKSILFFVVGGVSCFVGLRGGWQDIPVQDSDAYFCTQPIVNDASVNPLWNLIYNFADYEDHFKENPYTDFEIAKANEIVASLFETKKDTTISILTAKRPNVVFIILEGWSSYEIKSFGGDNYAPFMDSLSQQGIRFTKCYPAAYVSDQGIPAILSGYPSVSRISVINQSTKSGKLPCINRDLKSLGYQSGFVFGGDLNYGNIKSYIFNQQFDVVKEEKDFDGSLPRGNLGIQDADMENEYLKLLNVAKPPFIYAWFTLSTHMPYDYIGEKKKITERENEYVNSVQYADKAIQHFFTNAKKQSWFKNTLFVIVSDHSHGCQKDINEYDAEYHHIPLVFFGDVIADGFRGVAIENVVSQLDISKTLLKQINPDSSASAYVWSKNMFNPTAKNFAFYPTFAGGGFVTNKGTIGYQHGVKELIINSFEPNDKMADTLTMYSKAFQEAVYEDYRLK